MVLPPGVSPANFAKALAAFAAVVGPDWVFSSTDDIDTYRDAYSPLWGEPEERVPSAAVAPIEVEQVQRLVRIANQYKIPLYPISTGKNLTYGGSAPSARGSVVLDLKRMNRILEVDEDRHFALVEPGVAYFDFYNYIQEKNLKVWMDCPDPGWGSLIGNALDHGIGYTMSQFRDHFGAHCGMEVVLPNGEVMRTGMGAVPGSQSWQDYRYGAGPYVDGLFAQSNFGIVTKMGFWLMPRPQSYFSGTVIAPRYGDLPALVKAVNHLEDSALIGLPNYGSPASPRGPLDPDLVAMTRGDAWPSNAALEAFLVSKNRQAWSVQLQFYGPRQTVLANWDYAKEVIAAAVPGAVFRAGDQVDLPLTKAQESRFPKRSFGIPAMSVFAMIERTPTSPPDPPDGHLDLAIVLPRKGEALMMAPQMVKAAYREIGETIPVNPFATGLAWHARSFLIGQGASSGLTVMTYRNNPEANLRSRRIVEAIMNKSAERGWAGYRTAPAFQDLLMSKFSFNNGALLKFHEQIKDAIDPNGIISPGRYGIWPKARRKPRVSRRSAGGRSSSTG